MPKPNKLISFIRRQPRWRLIVVVLILAAGAWFWFRGAGDDVGDAPTFAARRGPLDITVLEGGNLQALDSQEIKCEVRVGYQGAKILKIVEEGYMVTEEDVKNRKVLVELDSSEIENNIIQQEIQYQSAAANLTEAQQNLEIQRNQNQSDIKAADQKVRFARMDFDKFLGDTVTGDIVSEIGLDKVYEAAKQREIAAVNAEPEIPNIVKTRPSGQSPPTNMTPLVLAVAGDPPIVMSPPTGAIPPVLQNGSMPPMMPPNSRLAQEEAANDAEEPEPEVQLASLSVIDFSNYANLDALGDGEAKQRIRKLEDDLQVAAKEEEQSNTTLEGTERLYEKGFVTRNELQRDEIAAQNSRLKVQTAETAQELFLKYEFIKLAEESLSKYADAVREYDKALRTARSKIAQAVARLRSAEGQFQVQSRRRQELQEQLDKCTILATKPGLVVYGSAGQQRVYYGNEEPIGEGATVRERQAIITIPDLTTMTVQVSIHESYIKKIKKEQRARVTVDAFPDEVLTGKVTKVGLLPDSQNRYMSPDMNVYQTVVTVDGTHDWVKPGMSAKVEIFVNRLDDVIHVPVQSISPSEGKQVCYVMNGAPERREVEVGEFNDEFIEIKSGLREGELVLLRPPTDRGKEQPADEQAPIEKPGVAPEESTAASPPPGKA
jgi:multidrug resistance efflux pump